MEGDCSTGWPRWSASATTTHPALPSHGRISERTSVHWDEWSSNPAEAAGKSTFDIATLLIPGGGEAAAAAKGGRAAADAAEAASAASRAETAATRGLENAAVPHSPAPAPHPETPPAPRPSGPPVDRPPPPTDKPVAPSPTKPASAPTDAASHHGPTESKPPAAANSEPGAQHARHRRSAAPGDGQRPRARARDHHRDPRWNCRSIGGWRWHAALAHTRPFAAGLPPVTAAR